MNTCQIKNDTLRHDCNEAKIDRYEAWAEESPDCHHCGSSLLWSDDRGAHCDECDGGEE